MLAPLHSLQNVNYTHHCTNTCVVCLDAPRAQSSRCIFHCTHGKLYCASCVERWVSMHHTCPICRCTVMYLPHEPPMHDVVNWAAWSAWLFCVLSVMSVAYITTLQDEYDASCTAEIITKETEIITKETEMCTVPLHEVFSSHLRPTVLNLFFAVCAIHPFVDVSVAMSIWSWLPLVTVPADRIAIHIIALCFLFRACSVGCGLVWRFYITTGQERYLQHKHHCIMWITVSIIFITGAVLDAAARTRQIDSDNKVDIGTPFLVIALSIVIMP